MSAVISSGLKRKSWSLLQQYQQSPSAPLRNQLVQLNIGLVGQEVRHWRSQCTESQEDLMQVGCLGLIRAIERFDLSKGNAFSSFAIPYIRGEIQHYLRDRCSSVRIPRRWQALQHQSIGIIRDLQVSLNRPPTDQEIAAALHVSLSEWLEVKLAYLNRSPLSLDAPVWEEMDGSTSLADLIPDRKYRSFQLAQEDQIRLQQGLVKLEKHVRDVLEFVFFYDLTQKETAERLGISVVTVSRRIKKGLIQLKQAMTGLHE